MATAFDVQPHGPASRRFVRLSLDHVRAANDIVISYDLDRDGWLIEAPARSIYEPDRDDHFDEYMEEVGFVPAWSETAGEGVDLINGPDTWTMVDVPVVDGVATLPNGVTVKSTSQVVRYPRLAEEER